MAQVTYARVGRYLPVAVGAGTRVGPTSLFPARNLLVCSLLLYGTVRNLITPGPLPVLRMYVCSFQSCIQ